MSDLNASYARSRLTGSHISKFVPTIYKRAQLILSRIHVCKKKIYILSCDRSRHALRSRSSQSLNLNWAAPDCLLFRFRMWTCVRRKFRKRFCAQIVAAVCTSFAAFEKPLTKWHRNLVCMDADLLASNERQFFWTEHGRCWQRKN